MKPSLEELSDLAYKSGELIMAGLGRRQEVAYKGEIDPVTETDHRSEDFLVREIQRRHPDHKIVTEERGVVVGQDCCQWLVDPLDGTVNFAHGVPIFAVSIAYMEEGLILLGVVYDPTRNQLFSAESKKGARLNGHQLSVSATDQLDQALLVSGFPYDIRRNPENNLDLFVHFSLISQGVRRLGSAALDLSYVAAGWLDAFWEMRLAPWDVAAGALIASESGAKVTTLSGGSDFLSPPCSILAANQQIHAQMLVEFARVKVENK